MLQKLKIENCAEEHFESVGATGYPQFLSSEYVASSDWVSCSHCMVGMNSVAGSNHLELKVHFS